MRATAVLMATAVLTVAAAGCSSDEPSFTPAPPGTRAKPTIEPDPLPPLGQFVRQPDGTEVSTVSADYLFDIGSDQLRPEAAAALEQIVPAIREHAGTVEVIGYTDGVGAADYNQSLSERRARAVVAILVADGIPESILEVVGKGEEGAEDDVADYTRRKVEIVLK
ncbi:MAG: OmpA family protein [Frankia sp.]|nr:OmpA family protein [Frankia sp.]